MLQTGKLSLSCFLCLFFPLWYIQAFFSTGD